MPRSRGCRPIFAGMPRFFGLDHLRFPQRHSIRLPKHDYAGGIYSITIGTADRRSLFGDMVRGRVVLSPAGALVQEEWLRTAELRSGVWLDAFVVMPNHMHALIGLDPLGDTLADPPPDRHSWVGGGRTAADAGPDAFPGSRAAAGRPYRGDDNADPLGTGALRAPVIGPESHARPALRAPALSAIIGGFKSTCTHRYRDLTGDPQARLWHRGYYEHLIRGPDQLARARRYIADNPRRWGSRRRSRS